MITTSEVFQIKGAEVDINTAQVLRSGQTFGWLRKKTRKLFVSRFSHRFCTVDFDARVLYYSHSEFGKKVSKPIPFCDILGVESVRSENDEDGLPKSCLPRIGKEDRHDFVLYTKGERKYLELRCSSATGCEKWISTIQAAMLLHKDDASKACKYEVDSEQSTRTNSRGSYDGMFSRESSMTNGLEQNSDGYASDEIPDQLEVDKVDTVIEMPLCRVPQSSNLRPGRALSTSPSSDDSPTPSSPSGSPFSSDTPDDSPFHADTLRCSDAHDKEDLQALLINAVLSSSTTCRDTWKRPQQPVIEQPPQPRKDSPIQQEDRKGTLPTIQEDAAEDEADKSPNLANLSFRERLLARGKGPLPPDIKIP